MRTIVLSEVSNRIMIGKFINCHDGQITRVIALMPSAKHTATDSAIAINC